jgi:NADPH-dependent 2,4-dienoyl-CoA reductase/sulfur reductase-like enzyme
MFNLTNNANSHSHKSNQIQTINTQVLVIGAGPGGYTAAFRAADLGKQVVLVEYYQQLGGVCLNVGCIPSKALLHAVHVIEEAKELEQRGVSFGKPKIDLAKLRAWVVNKTINKLTLGLKSLAALRKVNVINGHAEFVDANSVKVTDSSGNTSAIINFEKAIIAVGSRPIELPNLPTDPRIMNSTQALELKSLPDNALNNALKSKWMNSMNDGSSYLSWFSCAILVISKYKAPNPSPLEQEPKDAKTWGHIEDSIRQRAVRLID